MSPVRTFTSSPLPPRERGVEFGRANADAVRRAVAGYAALFARRGAAGFDGRRWATEFRDLIGDVEPDALAEIDGIAGGAGVDVLDVVAVNARTELLAKADPYGQRECSAVVVTPAEAPAYGVQTWDWYSSMADTWLHWRIPQPDGSWLETVTEYGLLAKIGVSSRGVGVLLNMLHHAGDDNDRVGLPVHLLSRRILTHATSCAEAAAMCHDTKVCASTSLTVLDHERGATVELFPDGPGVVEPTDGVLVRTNHFISDVGRDGCLTSEDVYPSSYLRLRHLEQELRARPPGSPDDVLAAMEHHDAAGGVCRHPQQQLEAWQRSATLATVVVEPDVPSLRVRSGGPCARSETTSPDVVSPERG
jgi:isopenicillin-N N-acyltransferase-like protein